MLVGFGYGYGTWLSISMDGIDYCSLVLVMDMVHGYQSQWMGLITAHWFWLWLWYMVINLNGWD
jgi:hypothetical protein